jgi:hypothetical protein
MTRKEGTYKGYKYQLIEGFFILREITTDTNTSKSSELWKLIFEINPEILQLREEGKIRIVVHIIREERWYELERWRSWKILEDEFTRTKKRTIDLQEMMES